MPKHRLQQAAFLTEAPIRSLFARKIRNALLVNAAVLAALRAKENVSCPATMLTASTPEVVAAATVAWSIFSVRLARGRNTHPLLRVSLAVAQRPAPRKQIAEKQVWSVARASALSRDVAHTLVCPELDQFGESNHLRHRHAIRSKLWRCFRVSAHGRSPSS